jgi:hypothetical protein
LQEEEDKAKEEHHITLKMWTKHSRSFYLLIAHRVHIVLPSIHPAVAPGEFHCWLGFFWLCTQKNKGEYFWFGSIFIKKSNQTEIFFFEKKQNRVKPTGFGSVRFVF